MTVEWWPINSNKGPSILPMRKHYAECSRADRKYC